MKSTMSCHENLLFTKRDDSSPNRKVALDFLANEATNAGEGVEVSDHFVYAIHFIRLVISPF